MSYATTEYCYAEPDEVHAFLDQNGTLHKTRDAAIYANVKADISEAIDDIRAEDDSAFVDVMMLLQALAKKHPQMLRDFIEALE